MVDIHWRYTQKAPRFFFLDARSFTVVLFFLVHARLWTFVLTLFVVFAFWMFERRGLSFFSAIRATRSWLLGKHRPATSRRARRRMIDFDANQAFSDKNS